MEETEINDSRVLIVDDEPMIRILLGHVLERYQIKSDSAENGYSALKKWKSVRYHAILMDINMPMMDGFQAITELRNEEKETGRPYTPVIAITSFELHNDSIKKAGFDHYIKKPFSLSQIYEVMDLVLVLNPPSP